MIISTLTLLQYFWHHYGLEWFMLMKWQQVIPSFYQDVKFIRKQSLEKQFIERGPKN